MGKMNGAAMITMPPGRATRCISATARYGAATWSRPSAAMKGPAAPAHLDGDLPGAQAAADAVDDAADERPLAKDRVLGVVEGEERDAAEHADPDHEEQLDLLEDGPVLAGEGEGVPADEVAVGEDPLVAE